MRSEERFRFSFAIALSILDITPTTSAQRPENSESDNTKTSNNNGSKARDPGVRAGSVNTGQPLSTLRLPSCSFFRMVPRAFVQIDSVSGGVAGEPGKGLGPGFNSNSCGSCHAQPPVGGTSPSATIYPFLGQNPKTTVGFDAGASNQIPFFITADGPVREARFPFAVSSNGSITQTPDGGVHDVASIAGRSDAIGCPLAQPNYEQMERLKNLIFRIRTPTFGAGLIENIADSAILANLAANAQSKSALGIAGHPNYSGNDGSITRFGWKAQSKSLEIFADEAYNVEMGVTNELFQTKRANPPASCLYNSLPEDQTNFDSSGAAVTSDVVAFAMFSRLLAPPAPSVQGIPNNPSQHSIRNGQANFNSVGCNLCHTATLQTAGSTFTAALSNQPANLYSDLLVHHMGSGLADNIS